MKSSYWKKLNPFKIAILDCCDYYNSGYIITRINVPKEYRGQGIGSELLKMCIKDADNENVTLWLEIQSSDGLSYEELESWYKRYGFIGFGIFYRLPRRN